MGNIFIKLQKKINFKLSVRKQKKVTILKVAITGAKGQLAREIIGLIKSGKSEIGQIPEEYIYCDLVCADVEELDITDEKAVERFVQAKRPNILINCAAMTNVDGCETALETAMKVNAIGPRNLSRSCKKVNAKIVHISTDYVFDGEKNIPYCEWDMCAPQSIYGKSKYLGEVYTREQNPKYFIIRTSWLYGKYGSNFVKTMMKLGKTKDEIKVVNDQRGNPTNANDLAHHILEIALTEQYGIYHCTGEGECSWFEFAQEVMNHFNLNCKVKPCTSDEFPSTVKRPKFSSLNNLMLNVTVGNEMRNWKEALSSFKPE